MTERRTWARKRDLAHRMTALANAVAPEAEATT